MRIAGKYEFEIGGKDNPGSSGQFKLKLSGSPTSIAHIDPYKIGRLAFLRHFLKRAQIAPKTDAVKDRLRFGNGGAHFVQDQKIVFLYRSAAIHQPSPLMQARRLG